MKETSTAKEPSEPESEKKNHEKITLMSKEQIFEEGEVRKMRTKVCCWILAT